MGADHDKNDANGIINGDHSTNHKNQIDNEKNNEKQTDKDVKKITDSSTKTNNNNKNDADRSKSQTILKINVSELEKITFNEMDPQDRIIVLYMILLLKNEQSDDLN